MRRFTACRHGGFAGQGGMVAITLIDADGTAHRVRGRPGHSLMETAVRAGVPGILAECGGNCACATCRVFVAAEWTAIVGPPNPMEAQLLDLDDAPAANLRLSCQVKLGAALDGLVVSIPAEQRS